MNYEKQKISFPDLHVLGFYDRFFCPFDRVFIKEFGPDLRLGLFRPKSHANYD